MKKVIAVLTMVAVLGMTGSAMAEVGVEIEVSDPIFFNGLSLCTVTAYATGNTILEDGSVGEPGLIMSISDFGLTTYTLDPGISGIRDAIADAGLASVHQVWKNATLSPAGQDTRFPEDMVSADWMANWDAMDTHLLIPADIRNDFADTLVETNDGSNPTGADMTGALGATFPGTAGLGTFATTDPAAYLLMNNEGPQGQSSIEIMQVVQPEGQWCYLSLRIGTNQGAFAGSPSNVVELRNVDVPPIVPEPGTFAMMVLGGLCLLGRRRLRR